MKSKHLPSSKLTWIVFIWILTHVSVGIPIAHFETYIVSEKDRENFLTTAVVVIGAIIGIVFSMSLVVIQNTASNYSPTILDLFKKDSFVGFTLSYGLFTIAFISSTILFHWETVLYSWVFFFWDLALLGIYLYYTMNKINPLYIIDEIKTSSLRYLNDIPGKVNKIREYERIEDKTGKMAQLQDILSASLISGTILKNNPDLMKQVRNYEVTLQHIILGSFRKDDYETSTTGLNVYPVLVENYLKINPQDPWHNDEFLQIILQRFEGYADKTITQNNLAFLKEVVDNCKNVGKNLTKIPTSGLGTDHIQSLALCIDTLAKIGQRALITRMFDGTSKSLVAIRELGQIALVNHKNDHLSTDKILEIGNIALRIPEPYISSVCITQLFVLIQTMISTLRPIHIITEIKNLTSLIEKYLQNGLSDYYILGLFSDISEIGVIPCVKQALLLKNDDFPKHQTRLREEDEKEILSLTIKMLGSIGNSSKTHNTLIAKNCADNLVYIASLCVKEQFKTFDDRHKEELSQIISALMSIYRYEPNAHTILGDEVISNIVEVAVLCAANDYVELANICIDRISFRALKILESDEHGYSANRVIRELNVLGCYAIMTSNDSLLNKIGSVLMTFDEKFEEKYHRISSDELDLDVPSYAVDRFERKYLYIETDAIMDTNNRIQFEAFILKQKITNLKSKVLGSKRKRTRS